LIAGIFASDISKRRRKLPDIYRMPFLKVPRLHKLSCVYFVPSVSLRLDVGVALKSVWLIACKIYYIRVLNLLTFPRK